MTFIVDSEAKRTFDPDRNLELIRNGGGSDMSRRFILRVDRINIHFSAQLSTEAIEGVDPELHAPLSRRLVWQIYALGTPPGYTKEQIWQFVSDALCAYKAINGKPAELQVRVSFGPFPREGVNPPKLEWAAVRRACILRIRRIFSKFVAKP